MRFFGILVLIIQVFFAVHAGRTGRYWWIFIILFFPMVGSLIYFFVEYLPDMRVTAKIKKSSIFNRPKSIEALQRELEITDSLKNRMNLAQAYFQLRQYQESIELFEKSLTGIYANNLEILEGLCYAHFYNGTYDKLIEYLIKYEKNNNDTLPNKLRLLRARAHEAKGELEGAIREYKAIVNIFPSEEARCRYAIFLKNQGHSEKAKEVFSVILKNAGLFPKQYARFEKEWVKIARFEIRQE